MNFLLRHFCYLRLRMIFTCHVGLFTLLYASITYAQKLSPLDVKNAWIRQTPASNTAAYMQVRSSIDCALKPIKTPIAQDVQLHRMDMQNRQMRMAQVPSLLLKAGVWQAITGDYHMMLIAIDHASLQKTRTIPITFECLGAKPTQSIKSQTVPFTVQPLDFEGYMQTKANRP